MPTLLLVHHTVSPNTHTLLEAAKAALALPELDSVQVQLRPALQATAHDVMQADAFLLATPANFGYMSGALKHFFDTIYYPCLDATAGRPFGAWVHGNNDATGATRGIEQITTGLGWKLVTPILQCTDVDVAADAQNVEELAATVAVHLVA